MSLLRRTGSAAVLAGLAATMSLTSAYAQAPTPAARDWEAEINAKIQEGETAAGQAWLGTFGALCIFPPSSAGDTRNAPDSATPRVARYRDDPAAPPRASWYADSTRVFDDLYWLGGSVHSAWLITDPEGYILIDTEYDYNSEVLVLDGMRRFGLDPKMIKYIIISHAHGDHIGGVELVQDATDDKAIVVLGQADWDLLNARPNANFGWMPNPDPNLRIAVPQDGTPVTVTVGSHSVTSFSTPPHSPGTISHTFTVHDWGRAVNVAYSGGTLYNFQTNVPDPGIANLETYLTSVARLAAAATATHATVLITNHSQYDQAWTKARLMSARRQGDPNPFEVGEDLVQRYFTVQTACTQAKLIGLEQMAAENK